MKLGVVALSLLGAACARTAADVPSPGPRREAGPAPSVAAASARAPPEDAAVAIADAAPPESPPKNPPDGPHELPLAPGRPIYYAFPGAGAATKPWRLVGHLHGVCGPPSYACGKWLGAGTDVGAMVCPTGNAKCGDSPYGPPSWEAPSWEELLAEMDRDLESSVAKVLAKHPGSIRRDGAVLTGYSRGAYAAAQIARMHPRRWPYLVLIEANVPLAAEWLKRAGVRAVALVAGEVSTEIAGERKTQAALERDGFPARLWIMPKAGHLYSDDMEQIMADALAWVLSHE